MARRPPRIRRRPHAAESGNDSFLDVVSNIVGILIILVMVVGVRAKESIDRAAAEVPDAAAVAQLEASREEEQSLLSSNQHLASELRTLVGETKFRSAERQRLAYLVAERRQELDGRRAQLDSDERAAFDASRRVAATRAKLDQVNAATAAALARQPQTIALKHRLNPISRMVFSDEVHFQVRDGLVTHVPLKELLDRLVNDVKRRKTQLRNRDEVTGTVGPVEGFRLRYTIERFDVHVGPGDMVAGSFARLAEWTLLPLSNEMGERLEDAVLADSEFRRIVTSHHPRRASVTLWVYPDGFAHYQQLKDLLQQMGYQIAGRPLPEGMRIGGSPHGTRSAAQ